MLTQIGPSSSEARGIAVQSDGRIVVGGTVFSNGATDDDFAVARYLPSGTLDRSFANDGILTTDFGAAGSGTPDRLATVLVQSDGKIIAVGSTGGHQGKFAIARYTSDGALDQAFGTRGKVVTELERSAQANAAAVEPGGKIVVAGGLGSADNVVFVLARYTADGNLDAGFGSGGIVTSSFDGGSGAHALAIQEWLLCQHEPVDALVKVDVLAHGKPSVDEQAQSRRGRDRGFDLRRNREPIAFVEHRRCVQLANQHLLSACCRQWDGQELHTSRGSQRGCLFRLLPIFLAIGQNHQPACSARWQTGYASADGGGDVGSTAIDGRGR
jgi:uncharacterized delta-60 repeat protein